MGDFMWHYTGAKEAFLQADDGGKVLVLSTSGRVLHTAPTKELARKWAKNHGYRLTG